jgi:hypothetical protein
MSLMRQTFHPTFARMLLAVVLVCALLVTHFGLSRHAVEHSATPVVAATTVDDPSNVPDSSGCLTCLEYQTHGNGLIGHFSVALIDAAHSLELQALAPNTPYLSPERASQRAPPVLS